MPKLFIIILCLSFYLLGIGSFLIYTDIQIDKYNKELLYAGNPLEIAIALEKRISRLERISRFEGADGTCAGLEL